MPGGSVNGKPFRESQDSYSRTGIPCGNPRRFHSQDVVRMEPMGRSRSRPIDGPVENIETEGERHLQVLVRKQMDTNITLQQQLQQTKQFSRSSELHQATDELSGVVTLDDYRSLEQTDGYIEEMRGYGLNNEEILYKLQSEEETEGGPIKKSRLSNPDYHAAKLKEINDKIDRKYSDLDKPDTFSDVKPLSRHEMELERSLAPASHRNMFLHKILIREKQTSPPANNDDPMNALPEIVAKITKQKPKDRKHRRNKHLGAYKSSCTLECCVPISNEEHINCSKCSRENDTDKTSDSLTKSCKCDDNHDKLAVPTCGERPSNYISHDVSGEYTHNLKLKEKSKTSSSNSNPKTKTKELTTSYSVKSKHQHTFPDSNASSTVCNTATHSSVTLPKADREIEFIEPIPEDAIKQYKLSTRDVQQIPRYKDYSPGVASNVLYVKNLSPRVTESDLASLFIRYQDGREGTIIFKLLTSGKMREQAFVTFPSVDIARQAMELVHGYEFKGKPIIVQFGRKTAENQSYFLT